MGQTRSMWTSGCAAMARADSRTDGLSVVTGSPLVVTMPVLWLLLIVAEATVVSFAGDVDVAVLESAGPGPASFRWSAAWSPWRTTWSHTPPVSRPRPR